ncbi:MAG: hypothetical protein M1838_001868 [Thelocarpon superellum]|nr:MAG: hypothetical protein M1838_001868 [Thelocarpon superellum]
MTLPEAPTHEFRIRIYKPGRRGTEPLPVLLWFHGGMWCAGDVNTEDIGCRAIITTVFSDAENAMKWVVTNASAHGGDPCQGFIVGGANAGAHLAASRAVRARGRHRQVEITGQLLVVPMLIAYSYNALPEAWAARLYSHVDCANVSQDAKRKGESFLVRATLEGLPPTCLAMDEVHPIRDDGFLYEHLLWEARVKTRVDYYRGLPDMFVQFSNLSPTFQAGIRLSAGVKWPLD